LNENTNSVHYDVGYSKPLKQDNEGLSCLSWNWKERSSVILTEERSFQFQLRQKPEQQQWLEAREGAYLLRTNLTVDGAADLWKKYMQLTEVEAAFRTLKNELAIRPLFHQLEKRVKAHVLVAFLGYALQVTLKHLLKRNGSEYSPVQALKRLSELYSVDIVLPTVEGREIWLRRITKREADQERLLNQLRLELPERLEPIQILKCSADSAIA